MTSLTLRIVGEPVAQGRPRFARVGGFMRAYDPEKSRAWKEAIKLQAADYVKETGEIPFPDGPIAMMATFSLTRPKSLPKRIEHHVKKPDCSNLVKGLEDALRGIIYRDDSQIVWLVVRKLYGAPGVVVEVGEVPNPFWEKIVAPRASSQAGEASEEGSKALAELYAHISGLPEDQRRAAVAKLEQGGLLSPAPELANPAQASLLP